MNIVNYGGKKLYKIGTWREARRSVKILEVEVGPEIKSSAPLDSMTSIGKTFSPLSLGFVVPASLLTYTYVLINIFSVYIYTHSLVKLYHLVISELYLKQKHQFN
jgi:hypothetical protein